MRLSLTIFALFSLGTAICQDFRHTEDILPQEEYENIQVIRIADDTLQSTFVIWVKHGVREHYHEWHTENILVLEGEAMMSLGTEIFLIKAGDYVNIPKGTPHSVTQVFPGRPLKVVSIQSPQFDGSDRVFTTPNE